MKASVILSHPYTKSFNHAIFIQVINKLKELNYIVYAHNLYDESFNPILTKEELGKEETKDCLVKDYIKEMIDSRILVFIHPNWWGQPPAIMKGYIDRVFRPPYAYDFPDGDSGGGLPIGKLRGKIGIVINTSNTNEERENIVFHDPLEAEWINCIFGFCGIINTYRKTFRIISDSNEDNRKAWLNEVDEIIKRNALNLIAGIVLLERKIIMLKTDYSKIAEKYDLNILRHEIAKEIFYKDILKEVLNKDMSQLNLINDNECEEGVKMIKIDSEKNEYFLGDIAFLDFNCIKK